MSRTFPSGTPGRAAGYITPARRRRVLALAAATGAAILIVVIVLFVAGRHGVASPGRVSADHASINGQCAQCHNVGHAVSDARCERCHDPAATHRLTQIAHASRGGDAHARAHAGETVACSACHVEHRGAANLATDVSDRTCVGCHGFKSLAKHPEVSAVADGRVTGIGLKFTHDRHVKEVRNAGKGCEACHQLAADLSGFEPIDYDRHCASCHSKDGAVTGDSDPIDGRLLSPLTQESPATLIPGARTLVTVSHMAHRDAWALDNLARLRRIADPDGARAERLALQIEIARLKGSELTPAFSAATLPDLQRLRASLAGELQAPAPPAADANAAQKDTLASLSAALDALGKSGDGREAAAPVAAAPVDDSNAVGARLDARKAELLEVLDAVARRGSPELAARAASLRARVTALAGDAGSDSSDSSDAGTRALDDRLSSLDALLRALANTSDRQAPDEARAASALRDAVRQQVDGGLPFEQFESRRTEMLQVLDAVARQQNPALDNRIASLREQVLALQAGERASARRARITDLLARVDLEIELANTGETARPSAIASERDRRAVDARLMELNVRLAPMTRATEPPIRDAASAVEALDTISSLAGPCLKCHELDGARLTPVAQHRALTGAVFSHKPHVLQADCTSCHGNAPASKLSTDVLLPGIASCESCHAPGKVRSDCIVCHAYHPQTSLGGVMAP